MRIPPEDLKDTVLPEDLKDTVLLCTLLCTCGVSRKPGSPVKENRHEKGRHLRGFCFISTVGILSNELALIGYL